MESNIELFRENHAAAVSLKNSWTRLASTFGCMKIVLTSTTLTIKPHRFIKWLIDLLRLDLSHEISVNRIKGAALIGTWVSYGKVELSFQTTGGEERKILLYMKQAHEFVEKVLNAIR